MGAFVTILILAGIAWYVYRQNQQATVQPSYPRPQTGAPPRPVAAPASARPQQSRSLTDYDRNYKILKDCLDGAGDRTSSEDFAQLVVNADHFVMNLSTADRRHVLVWIDDYMKLPPRVAKFGEVRDNAAARFKAWLIENS